MKEHKQRTHLKICDEGETEDEEGKKNVGAKNYENGKDSESVIQMISFSVIGFQDKSLWCDMAA